MDDPASATVGSDAQTSLAGATSVRDTEARILKSHVSEGVVCEEVCGCKMLLFTCAAFAVLFFDNCSCNLCVLLALDLSLSKMAKKIIAEDEGSAALQRRVVELKEANAQLKMSNAEMQQTIDISSEVVTLLRCELDEEIENYELLRIGNESLLAERNDAHYRVADLESELEEVKKSAARTLLPWRRGLRQWRAPPPRRNMLQIFAWSSPETWRIYMRHMSATSKTSAVFSRRSLVATPSA
jgi:hypothetical protein